MLEKQVPSEFPAAACTAMELLQQRLGFDQWMVARAAGDDWILLHTLDRGVGLREGTVLPWADTLCHAMVQGQGPRIAPRVADVPAYAQAAVQKRLKIAAYAGAPLKLGDGSLFGTLCAFHGAELPKSIVKELPLLELLARLLSTVLTAESKALQEYHRAERAWTLALTDELTGLYNRRGWDQLLVAEENRSQRHGHALCVISLDIDGLKSVNDTKGHEAGDAILHRTAESLRAGTRASDIVARVGGDEFAVLAIETDQAGGEGLAARLRAILEAVGVRASLGMALHDPARELTATWRIADQAMYEEKQRPASKPV